MAKVVVMVFDAIPSSLTNRIGPILTICLPFGNWTRDCRCGEFGGYHSINASSNGRVLSRNDIVAVAFPCALSAVITSGTSAKVPDRGYICRAEYGLGRN